MTRCSTSIHGEALAELQEAARQQSGVGPVPDVLHVEIGACLQALGRLDEARQAWSQSSPMDARRWLHEGLAARDRGDSETAEKYLERAEEGFLYVTFNKRPPDPLEASDIRTLWTARGNPPLPDDAPASVRAILGG